MSNSTENWHSRVLETKSGLFAVLTVVVILIGGLVEIVPMYTVDTNAPHNAHLVANYTPLEVAGRDIYVREGCYNCHSQMIRPMRAETLRYGEWSRAAEYVHDRPFQLGSRRIGPDLHRVGGKYPDAWHWEHMRDPRTTSPGSIMPAYGWLYRWTWDADDIRRSLVALRRAGEHYSDADIAGVEASMNAQAAEIVERLAAANITADPALEAIAMIAYLQRLGTDGEAVITGVAPAAADPSTAPASAPASAGAAPEGT